MSHRPHGAGKSSYDLIDTKAFFSQLDLRYGFVFLDLGCGRGDYSLAASDYLGEKGRVYAVDVWEKSIEQLKGRMAERGIGNIRPVLTDIGRKLPIEDHSVDVCLMATVFHDLVRESAHHMALAEIKRTLKPEGRLAVIEFKKVEEKPGPPFRVRISPEELDEMLAPHGFLCLRSVEIGPYNYLTLFIRG